MPQVFVGLLLGAALPWMFSGLAINAVGTAARLMVNEVRRQFRLACSRARSRPIIASA